MPEVKIIKADPERAAEIRSAKNGGRGRKMRVAAYCRVSTDAAEQKEIVIDEKEAEVVRYIFKRYVEGAGTTIIGHELEDKG